MNIHYYEKGVKFEREMKLFVGKETRGPPYRACGSEEIES
jgi:hypothetical protein